MNIKMTTQRMLMATMIVFLGYSYSFAQKSYPIDKKKLAERVKKGEKLNEKLPIFEATFAADIDDSDVKLVLNMGDWGTVNYWIEMKNRDRDQGSCVQHRLVFYDSGNNPYRSTEVQQFCVDGKWVGKWQRKDYNSFKLTEEETKKYDRLEVFFSPGGKSFGEVLGTALEGLQNAIDKCPDCKKVVIDAAKKKS